METSGEDCMYEKRAKISFKLWCAYSEKASLCGRLGARL